MTDTLDAKLLEGLLLFVNATIAQANAQIRIADALERLSPAHWEVAAAGNWEDYVALVADGWQPQQIIWDGDGVAYYVCRPRQAPEADSKPDSEGES